MHAYTLANPPSRGAAVGLGAPPPAQQIELGLGPVSGARVHGPCVRFVRVKVQGPIREGYGRSGRMMHRLVKGLVCVLAAAAAADGFTAPLAAGIGGRSAAAVARRASQPAVRPGRVALRSGIKVEGKGACLFPGCVGTARVLVRAGAHGTWWRWCAAESEEECDGPAKSGAIGNVDMAAAPKMTSDEIKTDGIINLTPEAIAQVAKLRESRGGEEPVLRVGVRAGGCR